MNPSLPYDPHIVCLLHDPWMATLHIVSDLAIWAAYFAIPACLWYFTRARRDFPFANLVVWFGIFIIGCGLTHFGNMLEVWAPVYLWTGLIKLSTALVSWITLAKLLPRLPQMLILPNLEEMAKLRAWMLHPQAERIQEMVSELDKIVRVAEALRRPQQD
jgi:hypothetical protein